MALSSFWHPRPWAQTTCHHPITLPPGACMRCEVNGFSLRGAPHMFLESRAMRKISLLKYEKGLYPFPRARHHPSEAGTTTEGASCHASQRGIGMTREIRSPSWGRYV